jgi:hypothetical protein
MLESNNMYTRVTRQPIAKAVGLYKGYKTYIE